MITCVVLNTLGPYLLGKATNLVFDGFVGKQLARGITKDQTIELLREQGQTPAPTCSSAMNVIPGTGVDFDAVGRVLMLVLALYVARRGVRVAAGLPAQYRHPPDREAAARRRRGEAAPAAAALLRHRTAW